MDAPPSSQTTTYCSTEESTSRKCSKKALNRASPFVTLRSNSAKQNCVRPFQSIKRGQSRQNSSMPIHSRLCILYSQSQTPIVSRIECMDSCGHPMSMARMPVALLIIGPIVEPQPQSCRTMNSWTGGKPARLAISRINSPVTVVVAYRWLEFRLMTIPSFILGWWAASCCGTFTINTRKYDGETFDNVPTHNLVYTSQSNTCFCFSTFFSSVPWTHS